MIELHCQKSEYEFTIVKEETDGQIPQVLDRLQVEDPIYMKVSFNSSSFSFLCDVSVQPIVLNSSSEKVMVLGAEGK